MAKNSNNPELWQSPAVDNGDAIVSSPQEEQLFNTGERRIEYELLTGHNRTDGTYKTSEQLRTEYLHLTDGLVRQMEGQLEQTEQGERVNRPDAVIFLDKSARPLAWLVRRIWPLIAREPGTKFEDGVVPTMPKMYFLNIDREQWVNTVDPQGVGTVEVDNVAPSIFRSLRSIFVEPKHKINKDGEADLDKVDNAPAALDGKSVLIVDEVRASGRTLEYARSFLQAAFPDTTFLTTHWMQGMVQSGQAVGNKDLPVWYKEDEVYGRGVGNRNDGRSNKSLSVTQRLGRYFLSTAHTREDEAAGQLRREFDQLARDLALREVLFFPDIHREADEFEERAVALNGLAFEEFIRKRKKLVT